MCEEEEEASTRLAQMQQLVRQAEFEAAERVGNLGEIPLAVAKEALVNRRTLFEGAQASVFRAEWRDGEVAVKKATIREAVDLVRFRREVAMLASSTLQHPNIVPLLGARMLPPDYLAVFELFDASAGQALHHGGWRPSVADVLTRGAEVALALAHLHERPRPIVHRDVKPGNVLLSDGRTVLGDFGLAQYQDAIEEEFSGSTVTGSPSGGFQKTKMLGTLEYMAPEILLKTRPASPASDVYALCVTINELLARVSPYSDCTRDNPLAHTILEMGYGRHELSTAVAAEGLRPSIPSGVPAEVISLLRRGWHADPSQRPTAGTVARILHRIAASVTGDGGRQVPSVGIEEVRRRIESQIGVAEDDECDEWTMPAPPGWVSSATANQGPSSTVPIGVFATPGARGDAMEDRGLIIHQVCMSDVLVCAVFDGHRGPEASDFLAAHLERLLRKHWTSSTSAADLLTRALLSAEDELRVICDRRNSSTSQPLYPGTTALCMALHGRELTIANIGDSRAMLCRAGRAIDVTVDQVAGRADERARIERAGHAHALKQHEGEWRVGEVGLAVTRSIGDFDAKPPLIADPEVTEHELGPEDEYVVLASDGVWDVLDGHEVASIIAATVKQPAMAAQRIVHTAVNERYSKDNATAIVCFLQGQATLERIV